MSKVQVSFEEVAELIDRLAEINALDFKDIEWTMKGVPVILDPQVAEDFKFTGLSNTYFFELGLHREPKL